MDVERRVKLEPGVEVVGNREGVPLRVGRGELTAKVPGAGYESGADLGRLPAEAQGLDLRLDLIGAVFWDVGNQQVLPDRQADRAGTVAVGDCRQPPHLVAGHPTDRQDDADVNQARLPLRMEADVGPANRGGAGLALFDRKPPEGGR